MYLNMIQVLFGVLSMFVICIRGQNNNSAHYYSVNWNETNEFENFPDHFSEKHLSGNRRLFKRTTDIKHYSMSCGKSVALEANLVVDIKSIFYGTKQYQPGKTCKWYFLGDVGCIPQITCEAVDLRTDNNVNCQEEHLLIMDGADGWIKLCDDTAARSPYKPAKGKDLFVILKTSTSTHFSRLFKGIKCEVTCTKPGPTALLPESNGLLVVDPGCRCGMSPPALSPKIVGGTEARKFEFPWLVAIAMNNERRVICAGSLINSRYVLTAAHCFARCKGCRKTFIRSSAHVILHMHDTHKTDKNEGTLRAAITRVYCHPQFRMLTKHDMDVCILQLDRHVDIVRHRPICLPTVNTDLTSLVGKLMTVAGWGMTREHGIFPSNVLRKVDIPLLSDNECALSIGARFIIGHMICAGIPPGGKDACQGDSGGPLMHIPTGKQQWMQLGLVSWGYGCGRKFTPGVYSASPVMIPWIKAIAIDAKWCKN